MGSTSATPAALIKLVILSAYSRTSSSAWCSCILTYFRRVRWKSRARAFRIVSEEEEGSYGDLDAFISKDEGGVGGGKLLGGHFCGRWGLEAGRSEEIFRQGGDSLFGFVEQERQSSNRFNRRKRGLFCDCSIG